MRLIHAGGFTKSERKSWKNVIFHNLVDAFVLTFEILHAHGDHVQDAKSEVGLPSSGKYTMTHYI
jgi:guanine nucleotide-binding protein subunit alpha